MRHPHWVESGFRVTVNGQEVESVGEPSSYVSINRTWKSGDVVEVETPLTLRLESMPDNPRRVAVFYGPLVLAGVLGDDSEGLLPVLVTNDRPVTEWLKPAGEPLTFRTEGVGRPADQTLTPFFGIHDSRYVVYWDIFTEAQWEQRRQEYEAQRQRERELAERTVDLIAIGEMQPERDHKVEGEKTSAGEFGGRKFRHANDGGWFSCEIKLPRRQASRSGGHLLGQRNWGTHV